MEHSAATPRPLVPFGDDPAAARFRLRATARRHGSRLELAYDLQGPLAELVVAEAAAAPERRDGLWQATCFEAFLAELGAEDYRELNLSPAGHWNLYRLDGYRRGLRPEPALTALPFAVQRDGEYLQLDVSLDLAALGLADTPLEIGLTAVLEHAEGRLGYWALVHPGADADFHRRDGFLLRL